MKNKITLRDILYTAAALYFAFSFILIPMTAAVNIPLAVKIVVGVLLLGGLSVYFLVMFGFDKKSVKAVAKETIAYQYLLFVPMYFFALFGNLLVLLILFAVWIGISFVGLVIDIVKYFKKNKKSSLD